MTKKYEVIKAFSDLTDNKYVYEADKPYPRKGVELNEERAASLATANNAQKRPLIKEVVPEAPEAPEVDEPEGVEDVEEVGVDYPIATGGSYFELSNGEKVQGKAKAIEAEKALEK